MKVVSTNVQEEFTVEDGNVTSLRNIITFYYITGCHGPVCHAVISILFHPFKD
jgi:hypothetical protein